MSYFSYDGPSAPMDSFVHEIFSVPLFEFTCAVEEQRDIVKELEKPLENQHFTPQGEEQDAFSSRDTLHEEPLFKNFGIKVVSALNNVWDKCGYMDIEPYITSMWGNSLNTGGSLHPHAHSNSFFSGVWYPNDVEIDDMGGGCVKFIDPLSSRYQIMPRIRKTGKFNSGEIIIRPKKSMLLIFPSWLEHCTVPSTLDKPRYSISFNIWMTGKLGHDFALNRLEF